PKQIVLRLRREPGTIIGDVDRDRPVLAHRGEAQLTRSVLDRVAGEVQQYPVELIAVGLDHEVGRDRAFDRHAVFGELEIWGDFVDQRCEGKTARRQGWSALAGKVEGARAQRDGTIDRVEEAWCNAAHFGRGT